MKKSAKIILSVVTALFIAAVLFTVGPSITARADFGDFSSGSDFGSSFSFSSGSDYSSGDTYIYSDGDSNSPWYVYVIIVVIIMIFCIITGNKKSQKRKGSIASRAAQPAGATPTDASTLRPMSEYTTLDPKFDQQAFTEKISNLYVQMQNGWTAKDISSLRPYFTDAIFTQMERQLEQRKKLGQTNYVENIAVLSVLPKGFMQAGNQDHIIVEVRTRITDYILDDKTGKLVSGDQKASKFMTYEYDLARATGIITQADGNVKRTTCPSCGAPLDINASARCEYCGSVITSDAFDWAITSIKGISQQTVK
jgi:hypothetical protein